MATLSITLEFSSDDGIAELFQDSNSDVSDGVYDSGEGNPSGSVRFDVAASTTAYRQKRSDWDFTRETFEDWGVPAGATVTGISNPYAENKHDETGASNGNHWHDVKIEADFSTVHFLYDNSASSGNQAWHSLPLQSSSSSMFPLASTDYFAISCGVDVDIGAGGSADVYYDNISFDIEYTTTGPTGTGALQAQAAVIAGAGTVTPVISATGVLQAQAAAISGYAYAVPGLQESAKAKTVDSYVLYLDGVAVPMNGFTLQRTADGNDASIFVPKAYSGDLNGATTITIDLESTDVYGSESVTEIFSGTLSTDPSSGRRRSKYQAQRRAHGAAGTPTNAVRQIANVSYISDDPNYYAMRTRVDERFWPGDVGMFNGRRININRVTFAVNRVQSYMELADVGQV